MLISLTVKTSGRESHALESLTNHKITTFRCKYLATMATGDDDNNNEDGNGATGIKVDDDGDDFNCGNVRR